MPLPVATFAALPEANPLETTVPVYDPMGGVKMGISGLFENLKQWIDRRVQAIVDGEVADAESTFAYYWIKNGKAGENFRR